MDRTSAKKLASRLKGKVCAGWRIVEYINCGKSAIVMKAERGGECGAIKIFDPELVERYGEAVQTERISREKSLNAHPHPNLIRVIDGGHWEEESLHYVIMEYLPWRNLADALKEVPVGSERSIIAQVAAAAQFLEQQGICHRDIKPENIAVSDDFSVAKLLDLGVILPYSSRPITDGTDAKVFIGTLKYSPPEFLLRTEENTLLGWRAITFYQLGGVLHDLIMRKSLFSGCENPYAVLVNAVQTMVPTIESQSVSSAMLELARNCLVKRAEIRLKIVRWDMFMSEPTPNDEVSEMKRRIGERIIRQADVPIPIAPLGGSDHALRLKQREITDSIKSICRLECVGSPDVFPPVEVRDIHSKKVGQDKSLLVGFEPSPSHGLSCYLGIMIKVSIVEPSGDVVLIEVSARVCGTPGLAWDWSSGPSKELYRGCYTAESARNALIPILYRAIDLAQQSPIDQSGESKYLELEARRA
jgi:serine/threonine protein kinase